MQSFILLPVHALWPNDILEWSHTDTVAPPEITAIINPEKDSSLITLSHKRNTCETQNRVSRSHLYKEKLNTALKMHAVKFPVRRFAVIKKKEKKKKKKKNILKLQSVTFLPS